MYGFVAIPELIARLNKLKQIHKLRMLTPTQEREYALLSKGEQVITGKAPIRTLQRTSYKGTDIVYWEDEV